MTYNTFSRASTLSPAEMSAEARRILDLLEQEDQEELERRLSPRAVAFVEEMQMARSLAGDGEVAVTEKMLWFLRDIKSKFD